MSNIYLTVTIEKSCSPQNFDFVSFNDLSPGQFWGAPTHAGIIEY